MGCQPVNVIDTHVWVWLIRDPDKISAAAKHAMEVDDEIGISAISCWEIGMLCRKGRLNLEMPANEWINRALVQSSIFLLPLNSEAATMAGDNDVLRWGHDDPADRLIVSTAKSLDLRLITADQTIHRYPGLTTIW